MVDPEKRAPGHSQHHEDGHSVISKPTEGPSAAMETALDATGGAPSPWGRGHIQLYLYCLVIYLCSTMNGTSDLNQPLPPKSFSNRLPLQATTDP